MAEGNKNDIGKPRLDLIPPEAVFALGRLPVQALRRWLRLLAMEPPQLLDNI